MNNTNTSSHYFHVYYGEKDQRVFCEDLIGQNNENLAAAILEFSQRHPECPLDKITNIERVNFNKKIFTTLGDEAAEIKFEADAFLYAVENIPADKDFNQEDLYAVSRILSIVKRKVLSLEKTIDDQLIFFEFNLERRN